VLLVRGNHEDANLVARYGFLAEGRSKYRASFDAAKILRAYDFLPVVLYLGSGTNFVQLCHGGMEPGYDPRLLLNSSGTNRYQLLGRLRQAEFLAQHPQWLPDNGAAATEARRHFKDFVPQSPTAPTVLGFMWNDFTVFASDSPFTPDPDRAFVYGKPAVESVLQSARTPNASVRAVIRAHQHSSQLNPLMRRLIASRGVFRHWQEAKPSAAGSADLSGPLTQLEAGESRPLPENSVWTLNVTPDSVYGAGCNFDFATFAVLQLAPRFEDWRIAVETVPVPGLSVQR
jgi:hypothetical protein